MTRRCQSRQYEKRLIVFTRCPQPGQCKTRLIPALGDLGANAVHEALVRRTMSWMHQAIDAGISVEVRYDGNHLAELRNLCGKVASRLTYRRQLGCDLGDRLSDASTAAFEEGVSKLVIIGTDCPQLAVDLVVQAFVLLDEADLVLGPAKDGGYYLMGIRELHNELFEDIGWGGPTVLSDTLRRALATNMIVRQLPTLADIDRVEDLHLIAGSSHLNGD